MVGKWIFLACLYGSGSWACTVFVVPSLEGPVLARNFDFPVGQAFIARNAKGIHKKALPTSRTGGHAWTSVYASVTLNQLAFEFPSEGMNEAGLSVASLWWAGADYPKKASAPTINELQWIQLQLDTYANVQQVVQNIDRVALQNISAPLHYFVCDPKECAVIEWIAGKPKAYVGQTLPIQALANDGYTEALKVFMGQGGGGHSAMDYELSTSDRFCKAARATSSGYSVDPIAFAFKTLNEVAQGDFTKWHSVYEPIHRRFHIRRLKGAATLTIDLKGFDLEGKKTGIADLDNTIAMGAFSPRDLQPKVPAHYCSTLISSLNSTGLTNIPAGLGATISEFVAQMHPSTR